MVCKNCGGEIKGEQTVCPYCDAPVVNREDNVEESIVLDVEKNSLEPVNKEVLQNGIIGKSYEFHSSRGANLRSLFDSRITSKVEVSEDRLFISMKPKRLNVAPAVLFEDITAIEISAKIHLYYWPFIIITALVALTNPLFLILTALFIFGGRDRKIRICQRNGKDVIMYAGTKAQAEQFKADMKTLTKIQ